MIYFRIYNWNRLHVSIIRSCLLFIAILDNSQHYSDF